MSAKLYNYPPSPWYRLSRDGEILVIGSEIECWNWIHRNTPFSVSEALQRQGFKMEPELKESQT